MIDPSIIPPWAYPILAVIFILVLLASKSQNNEQKEWTFTADELTIERTKYGDFQVINTNDNEACFIGNLGDCNEWAERHMKDDKELSKWNVKFNEIRVQIFR